MSTIPAPVGNRLSYQNGEDVYVGNLKGTNERRIARFAGCEGMDDSCQLMLIDFSPIGDRLTYSYDKKYLYHIESGTKKMIPNSVGYFSPRGTYLARQWDKKINGEWQGGASFMRYWDSAPTFVRVGRGVSNVVFSPDERLMVTTSGVKLATLSVINVEKKKVVAKKTLPAGIGSFKTLWLDANHFISVQSSAASLGKPGYSLILYTVRGAALLPKTIHTESDLFFTNAALVNPGKVLVLDNAKTSRQGEVSFSTVDLSGRKKLIKKFANAAKSYYELIGPKR